MSFSDGEQPQRLHVLQTTVRRQENCWEDGRVLPRPEHHPLTHPSSLFHSFLGRECILSVRFRQLYHLWDIREAHSRLGQGDAHTCADVGRYEIRSPFLLLFVWEGRCHISSFCDNFFFSLSLPGHTGTIYGLAVVTDGQGYGRLFSASYDRSIRVRCTPCPIHPVSDTPRVPWCRQSFRFHPL